MTIGVDVDSTVNTLTEAVLDVYNERHGTNYTESDIKTYSIEDNIPGCNRKEIESLFLEKEVWKRVKVIPDAVEYIKMLHEDNHKIYFISATLLDNVPKKASWLRRNFPFLDIEKCFIPCKNKYLIDTDILIDDCFDNIRNRKMHSGIIYDKPWNQGFKGSWQMRAKNWEEVYMIIKEDTH